MASCDECGGEKQVTALTPDGIALRPCPKCAPGAAPQQVPPQQGPPTNFNISILNGTKTIFEVRAATGEVRLCEMSPPERVYVGTTEFVAKSNIATGFLLSVCLVLASELARAFRLLLVCQTRLGVLESRVSELETRR